jgi:hypothetical protein
MNTKLRSVAVLFAITVALVWCIPAVGQVLKGSISGTVVDPQGAVVSGAEVKAKNVETGVVATTTSDSSGLFRLNLLSSGTYNVEVTAKGFKTAVSKGASVNAGADTGLGALHLSVGETSTTVEVTSAAPLIETTQSQVTNTFSGTMLNQFAGVQENEGLDRMALFVPGVVATRSDNFSNTNGTGFSSNGLRGRNNDQEIDGQNNNDNSVGGPSLFLSNVEFVQQYVLVTNQFGPEYGRNAGSVVNVITKSGTNAWHGSVFGQERSSYLQALSNTQKNINKPGTPAPLTPGCPTSPQVLCNPFTGPPRFNEEFSGGAIGGPVVKNKWFLFGGFDSDLFNGSNTFVGNGATPTPAGLATLAACPGINAKDLGILTNFGPYAFTQGNPTPLNPTLNTIAGCTGVQTGGVVRVLSAPFHGFDFVVRNDIQIGGDSIMARYLYNRGNSFNGTGTGSSFWIGNVPDLNQGTLVSWTHNFTSRMVNEARIGYTRLNVEFGGGSNPFFPVAQNLEQAFTNISFSNGNLGIGPATNLPQMRLVNTWQAQDNWNYVLGKHSFKAGVNWTYQRSPNIFLPIVNGQYRFTSLSTFLATAGTPNRVQIAQGKSYLDFREYDTFAYAGDDWKIGPNLTLNLGVTWTYYGQPANLFHDITAQREANPATALWKQTIDPSITTNPQLPSVTNSFGPSVGFAYTPQWGGFITGHGKTTFRGGYRMLYDPPFYNIFVNISSSSPMTFLQSVTGASLNNGMLPAVPTGPNVRNALGSLIQLNAIDPRTQLETGIDPNFRPDKVHSWSFGFEREVTKNAALEVRYVGNHAVDLFQTVDGNPYVGTAASPGQLQAGLLPAGTPSCAATQQLGTLPATGPTDLGRLACGLGIVRTRNNGGFSDYHGLQTEFRTNNLFKQLTLRTTFTWAKTLDNVSEIFATGTAGNTLFAAQNPFQTGNAERSISGLDIPHAFTVVAIEQVPFFKEQKGLIGHILGGWVVSADYIYASGQAYTPQQAFSEALNGSNNGPATGNPFGNVYDSAFVNSFVGTDTARPFLGNASAPLTSIGVYAHDACAASFFVCTPALLTTLNGLPANQLVSLNALNATSPADGSFAGTVVPVTSNDVRLIMNTRTAELIFGTPFGNMPRNYLRDAKSNLMNATIYKNIKLGERVNFQMNLTLNNALNHFNFGNVNPSLEFAGLNFTQFFPQGGPFGTPAATGANGRTIWVGGKLTF